jgi:hypothetical protein
VAVCRPGSSCPIFGALAVIPNRASSASFTGATAEQSTAPVPSPSTNAARSRARTMPLPDSLVTGVRIHSSVETFLPSGTASVPASSCRICAGAAPARAWLISSSPARRTSVTSRDNVVIPGSSTRPSISHSTARSNRSRRLSRVLATREATKAATSASAPGNSRYPSRSGISHACSYGVCCRSPYSFTDVQLPMPSCSATYRITTSGTLAGPESVRNVPSIRTVPHWIDQPSRLCGRRLPWARSSAAPSRKKNFSSSSAVGSATNRPYRDTCSSDKYSCGMTRYRRRSPAGYPVVRPNRGRLIQLSPARHPGRRGAGLKANFRPDSPKTPTQ